MRTRLIIVCLLLACPVKAAAEDISEVPKKSFFDFSKYVTVEPVGEPIQDSKEELIETASEEELAEQVKLNALQKKASQLKDLRQKRKQIFEEYNSEKLKVDEQYNELSKQLSEHSTNTKMAFDLNRQINAVRAEKKRLLQNFRDKSAKLSQQIDDLQGRSQQVEEVQRAKPKIQPVQVKPSMSIREKLKRQGTVTTRKKPSGGNRRTVTTLGGKTFESKKSYIKKTGRNANKNKAKPKSSGRLLDQLKSGR